MGKRKSRSVKIMKAPPPKVEKVFDCPFCSHSKTVEVKLQRPLKKATLSCRICRNKYEFPINRLMIEVDVFHRWIDECERINQQARLQGSAPRLGFAPDAAPAEAEPIPQRRP